MKQIKSWKLADLILQLLAIVLPWVYFIVFPGADRLFFLGHLVSSYFAAGMAQAVSCGVNWRRLPKHYRAGSRSWYEIIMACLLAMALIATAFKSLLLLLMLLFYIVPVITIWYVGIVIAELVKVNKSSPGLQAGVDEVDTHRL